MTKRRMHDDNDAKGRDLQHRTEELRCLVFEGLSKAIKMGYQHSPEDGVVMLDWPSIVEVADRSGFYRLSIRCGSMDAESGGCTWRANTWEDAFERASRDVKAWIADLNKARPASMRARDARLQMQANTWRIEANTQMSAASKPKPRRKGSAEHARPAGNVVDLASYRASRDQPCA